MNMKYVSKWMDNNTLHDQYTDLFNHNNQVAPKELLRALSSNMMPLYM